MLSGAFRRACERVSPSELREKLRVSSDPARHAAWLAEDIALGFSALYLHNVGRNQEAFIETFATRVLPQLG